MKVSDYRPPLPALTILRSPQEESLVLGRVIREVVPREHRMRILEAGCGLAWEIDLHTLPHTLVGVDRDADALDIRKLQKRDLHEAILGDLRTVQLEAGSFDVVFNSFVLEHIQGADAVLGNFWRWLRPGGILIVRLPDRSSVYGFMTRFTPFWFHVLFKKYIEGVKDAGKPGFVPFPTFYDAVVSRRGIRAWCENAGGRIQAEYGSRYYFDQLGLWRRPLIGLLTLVGWLSLGRLASDHNNLTFVIEKPR